MKYLELINTYKMFDKEYASICDIMILLSCEYEEAFIRMQDLIYYSKENKLFYDRKRFIVQMALLKKIYVNEFNNLRRYDYEISSFFYGKGVVKNISMT